MEKRVRLKNKAGVALGVGEGAQGVVDRLGISEIAARFEQGENLVARDVAVNLQDDLGPVPASSRRMPRRASSSMPCTSILMPWTTGSPSADAVPDRVEADGDDRGHLEPAVRGQLRVDHAALGREPRHDGPRRFGQGKGEGNELVEAVGPAGAFQAGGRGQGRLEREDPPPGPTARARARLV